MEGNHTSLSHFVSSCTITVRFLHARLPSTGLSRVELFISVRRAAISQVNAAETGNYQRFREALTRARPVTLRSAGTPVMHRGIVAAQPLCKHLRKWQNPALGRSKNSYAEISNIPPALQSCETSPEGWPCLSMDSVQIAAVKVS